MVLLVCAKLQPTECIAQRVSNYKLLYELRISARMLHSEAQIRIITYFTSETVEEGKRRGRTAHAQALNWNWMNQWRWWLGGGWWCSCEWAKNSWKIANIFSFRIHHLISALAAALRCDIDGQQIEENSEKVSTFHIVSHILPSALCCCHMARWPIRHWMQ